MRDQIVIPDPDPNQLVFITKMGVSDKELDATIDAAEAEKLKASVVVEKPVKKTTKDYSFGKGLKIGGTVTNAAPKKEYSFGKGLKGVQATAQPEAKPKYEFKGASLVMPEGGTASF